MQKAGFLTTRVICFREKSTSNNVYIPNHPQFYHVKMGCLGRVTSLEEASYNDPGLFFVNKYFHKQVVSDLGGNKEDKFSHNDNANMSV